MATNWKLRTFCDSSINCCVWFSYGMSQYWKRFQRGKIWRKHIQRTEEIKKNGSVTWFVTDVVTLKEIRMRTYRRIMHALTSNYYANLASKKLTLKHWQPQLNLYKQLRIIKTYFISKFTHMKVTLINSYNTHLLLCYQWKFKLRVWWVYLKGNWYTFRGDNSFQTICPLLKRGLF